MDVSVSCNQLQEYTDTVAKLEQEKQKMERSTRAIRVQSACSMHAAQGIVLDTSEASALWNLTTHLEALAAQHTDVGLKTLKLEEDGRPTATKEQAQLEEATAQINFWQQHVSYFTAFDKCASQVQSDLVQIVLSLSQQKELVTQVLYLH
jgi:hypothetical protein